MTVKSGKLFISHASADKEFVDKLVKDLTGRGVDVWYDKFDIQLGDSVPGKINEGIADSKYFAIVLSPASVTSKWVTEELNAALIKQISLSGTFLLPLMFKDCNVPPLLAHRRYADFRSDYASALSELLDVLGKDADMAASLDGKALYPWPDTSQSDMQTCYLYSARFDKFFRMACDFSWTADRTIDYITEALKLPWNQDVPQLGMRWSFSYGLVHNDQSIPLRTTLEEAGVSTGSVLRLNISGTYEDVWEKELKSMWDGSKMYEIGSAMRREQELRSNIQSRGSLTRSRLKELANECFKHV